MSLTTVQIVTDKDKGFLLETDLTQLISENTSAGST